VTEAVARIEALWRRSTDRSLAATWIALGLVVLLVAQLVPGPARALLSLPVLLLAPGAALQLLLGRRLRGTDRWLNAALSLVLSLALLPLLVLLLYAVHRPLDSSSIIAVVVDVTIGMAAIGALFHPDDGSVARVYRSPRRPRVPVRALAAAAVVVATGVIILVTWASLPGATPARYSAIALSGSWAKVTHVTVVPPHQKLTVDVRVENHTARTVSYQVVPKVAGGAWQVSAVTLAPGRSWSGDVSGTMPSGGCLHRLRIALRCDAAAPACTQSLIVWTEDRKTLPSGCTSGPTGA
jgi:hypothetical protein